MINNDGKNEGRKNEILLLCSSIIINFKNETMMIYVYYGSVVIFLLSSFTLLII